MRWSYKTVRFDMKKEGLLGSAYLDESEIEITLNEFGEVGWELVSLLEVQDGIIGVFKQPFTEGRIPAKNREDEKEREGGAASKEPKKQTRDATERYLNEAGITGEWGNEKNDVEPEETDKSDSDVGSIRIE